MNRVRLSLRLRAAWHEVWCRECRVTWRGWWHQLRGHCVIYNNAVPPMQCDCSCGKSWESWLREDR